MMPQTMGVLIVVLGLYGCGVESPDQGIEQSVAAPPSIEFRLARDQPAPGLLRMEVPGSTAPVYVETHSVISNADIRTVRAYVRRDRLLLDIALEPKGAKRLEAVTGRNIGGRIVVLVDSQLLTAPVIASSIGQVNGSVMVVSDVPQTEAARIAMAVTAAWPPAEHETK